MQFADLEGTLSFPEAPFQKIVFKLDEVDVKYQTKVINCLVRCSAPFANRSNVRGNLFLKLRSDFFRKRFRIYGFYKGIIVEITTLDR
jgi:hypothetical protein